MMNNMVAQANTHGVVSVFFNAVSIATSLTEQVNQYIPILSGLVGVFVGLMAIRYYVSATRHEKIQIDLIKMQREELRREICDKCNEIKESCNDANCKHKKSHNIRYD